MNWLSGVFKFLKLYLVPTCASFIHSSCTLWNWDLCFLFFFHDEIGYEMQIRGNKWGWCWWQASTVGGYWVFPIWSCGHWVGLGVSYAFLLWVSTLPMQTGSWQHFISLIIADSLDTETLWDMFMVKFSYFFASYNITHFNSSIYSYFVKAIVCTTSPGFSSFWPFFLEIWVSSSLEARHLR